MAINLVWRFYARFASKILLYSCSAWFGFALRRCYRSAFDQTDTRRSPSTRPGSKEFWPHSGWEKHTSHDTWLRVTGGLGARLSEKLTNG